MTLPTNRDIIVLARESRGLTQKELADSIGISQSALSKYENGLIDVPDDQLFRIATTLEYPPSLFSESAIIHTQGGCIFYRKRQSLSVGLLTRISSSARLTTIGIRRLLRGAEIETKLSLPTLDISEYGDDPEHVAALVRRSLGIPMGPIKNLVEVIERIGGVVILSSFGTDKLDAFSQAPEGMPPLFFVNTDLPWERIRLTLAHEIGHLVMHSVHPTHDLEDEANRFAAALLMPEQEIRPQLEPLTIPRLFDLKRLWRVSIAALIRRARDVGAISESKYRRMFMEIGKLGWRKSEPYPVAPEHPALLKALIEVHVRHHGYSLGQIAEVMGRLEPEFHRMFLSPAASPLRILSQ